MGLSRAGVRQGEPVHKKLRLVDVADVNRYKPVTGRFATGVSNYKPVSSRPVTGVSQYKPVSSRPVTGVRD